MTHDDMVAKVRDLQTLKVKGIRSVKVCVRVSNKRTNASGHYTRRTRRIVVTFCNRISDNWETLIHEFCHAFTHLKYDDLNHDLAFKMTLCEAISEFTGGKFVFVGSNDMRDLDVAAERHIAKFYRE